MYELEFIKNHQMLQEFNSMDENMTEHLVNVQQQALQLAMIVQRIEDGQNSAAGQTGERP